MLRCPLCHGKVITGAAGGLRTPTRPAPLPCCPCPHSSPPNQCRLHTDTSRPFITLLTASVQPQNRAPERRTEEEEEEKKKRGHDSVKITPLHLRFVLEENEPCGQREKSSRGTEILPFDSSLSPSRSSRLSPAPTAPQNTTISSISSAWLPRFLRPPAWCRGSARGSAPVRLWLWLWRLVPVGCVRAERVAERLRQASSVGQGERREQEAASQHQRGERAKASRL